MKNKTSILFLIGIMLIVQFFWIKSDTYFDKVLPFLSGLTSADTAAGNMLLIMYAYLPFPFFLLYFSGAMRELTTGYGLLLMVRGSNKEILLGTLMGKTLVQVMGLTMVMVILYTVGKPEGWIYFEWVKQFQGGLMYSFAMITLIQMQYFLELHMESHYANGAVILWGISSLLVSGSIGKQFIGMNLLLFPNLSFAQKNGVLNENEISFVVACGALIFIYSIFTGLILQRLRRKDMI